MMRKMTTNILKITSISLLIVLLWGCGAVQMTREAEIELIDLDMTLGAALEAYNKKDYKKAARFYKRALVHNQDAATIAYNLACCYALEGDEEKAVEYIQYAVAKGFRSKAYLHKDPDFDRIREGELFKETLDHLDNRFKAIGRLAYVKTSSLQPYRIRFPENYDASKPYPLLIGLHGYSGNADGFIALYERLEDPQIIYVTPEGPYRLSNHVGSSVHSRSWAINSRDKVDQKNADKSISQYIMDTIHKVSSEVKISKVYLFGFSQGAAFAYNIGIQNTKEIAGVIGFGGYLMETDEPHSVLSSTDIARGKDLRVFIAHGTQDMAVDIKASRTLAAMLSMNGYETKLHEFEGGHEIPGETLNLAVNWMNDPDYQAIQ